MRSEWRACALGEAITLKRGYDLPAKERRPGTVPIVSSSGFSDIHSDAMVKGPGVVTGRYGTIGQVFYVDQDFWPLNTTLYVQDFKGNDPRFVSYMLRTVDFHQFSDKAAVPGVNRNHLHTASITLPPLAEQMRISEVLQSLDDRIDLLRQTNATLESIAQALFKSWFIDFDPVRAKAEGREPEGMDAATAALFPADVAAWVQASPRVQVGELISKGILTIGDGYRAKNEELGTLGVPFVRAGDLLQGRITPTADHLSAASLVRARGKSALPGDTAFTSKGTIGRFAYVDETAGDAVYSPQVCFWRSANYERLAPAVLHFWMKSALFSAQVDKVKGQAAIMDFVSLSDQRRMVLDVPPQSVQARFADCVDPLLRRMSLNRANAAALESVRDTLLPRLISGRLRLPEAQEQLADALA